VGRNYIQEEEEGAEEDDDTHKKRDGNTTCKSAASHKSGWFHTMVPAVPHPSTVK
jgi:hypothetical protein